MRISDWSSDVCSSDLAAIHDRLGLAPNLRAGSHGHAQHLACGKLGNGVAFDQAPRLRSLSCSRRSEYAKSLCLFLLLGSSVFRPTLQRSVLSIRRGCTFPDRKSTRLTSSH